MAMDELASKRAERNSDSRLWSAEDALEDLLGRIRSGKVKPCWLAIHYMEGDPEKTGMEHGYVVSGVTYPHHLALLQVGIQHLMKEWLR